MTIAITLPEVPEKQRGIGSTPLRYEDIAQDGRLRLEGVWPPIGPILWGKLDFARVLARLGEQGVRAVLTHVTLEGSDEPVSVRRRVETEVRFRLAHTVDDSGAVNRVIFDTWLELRALRAVPGRPHQEPDGPLVVAARGYGQHVFTRPAAARGQHRVTSLTDPELEPILARTDLIEMRSVLRLPDGAEPLDPAPRFEPQPVVFGLCHTDGNQHVNFLTYPRMAEEAALRRFSETSGNTRLLARRAQVSYRKPCFAGERMFLMLQSYLVDDEPGAVVAFYAEPRDAPASLTDAQLPHAVVRLGFR